MNANGFTLVELITVIVLISVLAVFAVARLDLATPSAREATGELIGAQRHAQHLALTHSDRSGYHVALQSSGYRVRDDAGNDVKNPLSGTTPFIESWDGVSVTPTGTVTFDSRGAPNCSGGQSCTTSNAQVTVSVAGGSEVVVIERVTGYVR